MYMNWSATLTYYVLGFEASIAPTGTLCCDCLWLYRSYSRVAAHRSSANTSHRTRTCTIHTHTPLQGLLPLLSCAALLDSRKCDSSSSSGSEQRQVWADMKASGAPAVQGRVFVRQDTTVRTGLPFHIDGPFFVSAGGRGGLKVSTSCTHTINVRELQCAIAVN
jgi:hypothetical protein